MSSTRSIEESIDIRASPEAVWKAMTEAEEITRWFALTAETRPGVGGKLDLHWGPEVNWPMAIRVWDPPRHVRLEDHYPVLDALKKGARQELFIDYFVEPQNGGVTRLRVVHSGFSRDASWDGLYDSTSCGWRCEIAALRFYLERCKGQAREWLWIVRELKYSLDEAYSVLLGPDGLALEPREAATRELTTAHAAWRSRAPEAVTILRSKPSRGLVVAPVESPGVMMMVNAEPPQEPSGERVAMIRFNLYDRARLMAAELKAEWETRLEKLFG